VGGDRRERGDPCYPPYPNKRSKVNEEWYIDGKEVFAIRFIQSQYNRAVEFATEDARFRIYEDSLLKMLNYFNFKAVINKRRQFAHLEEVIPKFSRRTPEVKKAIEIRMVKKKLLKSIGEVM
jgi:hypothetical protein